jgi:serine/threonine protein phosphatase PrpC
MKLVAGVATDVGRVREGNEDAYLIEPPLYAVADGMGGAKAGEVASQLALQTVADLQRSGGARLEDEVVAANKVVFARANEEERFAGMGTTLTAALATADAVRLAHVGDSRAYLLRAGSLRQLTRDHTLVDRMVEAGEITRDEADVHPHRNVLLRALGTEPTVEVESFDVGLLEGDRVLLCSDGLTVMVTEEQIKAILEATAADPQDAAERLVRAANRAGGVDNITAVVLDAVAGEPDPGAVAEPQPGAPPPAERVSGDRARRRRWRWVIGAVAAVVVAVVAFTAFRSWLDGQWYVGVANGHVAIYNGIPAQPFGIDLSHVDEETSLDAAGVAALGTFQDLEAGINVDSLEQAQSIVEQMRQDLRDAQRQQHHNKKSGGGQ